MVQEGPSRNSPAICRKLQARNYAARKKIIKRQMDHKFLSRLHYNKSYPLNSFRVGVANLCISEKVGANLMNLVLVSYFQWFKNKI